MSDEELKAELERLRRENAALKKGTSLGIRLKVSEKGAVSARPAFPYFQLGSRASHDCVSQTFKRGSYAFSGTCC